MKWQEWREYADNETLWQDHQEKLLSKSFAAQANISYIEVSV